MNTILKNRRQYLVTTLLGIAALLIGACQSASATSIDDLPTPVPTAAQEQQTLILGDVNEDVQESIDEFQPMADYLAANLSEFGITKGEVVVAPDVETMVELLKNDEVHLYFDSPFAATVVYNEAGAVPLLRRWKDGIDEYYSVIVVRQDSGFETLDDLKGQIIAFEDPGSTSGYIMPKAHLLEQGYVLVEKDSLTDAVAENEIGYVFAQSEENVSAWLLNGDVAASALNVLDFEELVEEEGQTDLVVIGQGKPVPRHVALASPKMDEELQQRVTELLLAAHETEEGQAVLEAFEETSQFDEFPGGAEATMEELKQLFAGQE